MTFLERFWLFLMAELKRVFIGSQQLKLLLLGMGKVFLVCIFLRVTLCEESTMLFEGTLVIGLILRSLWGLYKIHETLWFYLVAL